MRTVRWVCGVVVLLGALAAVATAQSPPPNVAVTAGKGTITVPPGAIAPGPTRFTFTRSGNDEVEAFLVTLRAGVTVDQLRQSLSQSSEASLGLVFIEASADLSGQSASRAVTVDLRPNVTYVAVSIAGQSSAITPFTTTGTANGATAPAPDARIRMVDYGFRGAATLPRNGRIRVDNQGSAFHFMAAFRLKSGVKAKRVGRAFRSGSEKAIGKVVAAGPPLEVQDLISPQTTNVQEVTFPRAGRYTLVCFFGGHNRLGMYRIVRVR